MSAEVIAAMLRIASQDLDGARLLNQAGNRNAAYLCEQAAEKVIRAVLTSEGIQAGIRHELPDMVDKIPDDNPVKPALRAIEHLAAYATAFRVSVPAWTRSVATDRCRTGRRHREDRGGVVYRGRSVSG
jgi:HEPN domain-containing protein